MDAHVGDAETPVEGTGLQADHSGQKNSKSSESSDRQHQDKILEKCVESCEKDETKKHKDGSDIEGPQNKDKFQEQRQRIDSDVEPRKAQEDEAGDSMASTDSPLSLKAEKTTNEEILQAEQDGKTLNFEDVPVECQNQQDAKRITDDLRNKIEQLKAENTKLQNYIDESSIALRNTNLDVDRCNEALKSKEGADKYISPACALQTLSAQNVLHVREETESLISQSVSLLPEQQDQSQLKEITMPEIHLLHDILLSLKLEVEDRFRKMKKRLSACREDLQKQNAKLMTVHHENQERKSMNHKMKRELQNMGTDFSVMLEVMEKSRQGQHDTERVKIMEDVAASERMLKELEMRNKDLKQEVSALKTEKKEALGLLSLQLEQNVEECHKLSEVIHRRHNIWQRLRRMFH